MTRTLFIAAFAVAVTATLHAADTPNTLTNQERADGWKLLFDGTTTSGWRGYKKDAAPEGWQVVDGAITLAGKSVGDLITVDEYENFEFAFEWKISQNGNSGVFYLVQEKPELKNTYNSGPEYQVLDNDGHPDAKNGPDRFAGANYALQAPTKVSHQARRRVEPEPHRQERRARRALAQWREGRRVRAVERCLEGAGRQEQVQRDAGVRHGEEGLPRAAGPRQPGVVSLSEDQGVAVEQGHELNPCRPVKACELRRPHELRRRASSCP